MNGIGERKGGDQDIRILGTTEKEKMDSKKNNAEAEAIGNHKNIKGTSHKNSHQERSYGVRKCVGGARILRLRVVTGERY